MWLFPLVELEVPGALNIRRCTTRPGQEFTVHHAVASLICAFWPLSSQASGWKRKSVSQWLSLRMGNFDPSPSFSTWTSCPTTVGSAVHVWHHESTPCFSRLAPTSHLVVILLYLSAWLAQGRKACWVWTNHQPGRHLFPTPWLQLRP